jgi:hypothetical protein
MVMVKYLKDKGYKNIISNNLYVIAEGELPICICAHMDTVFPKVPYEFYYDEKKAVLWSPQGLGADDRAGNYAIIELLERGYRPSIILTDLEERGGIGASELVEKYPECPFSDCRALIQLDRCGERDSVYYECDNEDFEKLINSYGFKTNWGTFTDISIFGPAWEIAAVNLSIGYYNEHTQTEILNMLYLHKTISKVERMLKDCQKWESYSYIPMAYPNFMWYNNFTNYCVICNNKLGLGEGHRCYAEQDPLKDYYMCDSCYNMYNDNDYTDEEKYAETEHPQED